jgi:hypothetical protein
MRGFKSALIQEDSEDENGPEVKYFSTTANIYQLFTKEDY